jgi:hypothetical protein
MWWISLLVFIFLAARGLKNMAEINNNVKQIFKNNNKK